MKGASSQDTRHLDPFWTSCAHFAEVHLSCAQGPASYLVLQGTADVVFIVGKNKPHKRFTRDGYPASYSFLVMTGHLGDGFKLALCCPVVPCSYDLRIAVCVPLRDALVGGDVKVLEC